MDEYTASQAHVCSTDRCAAKVDDTVPPGVMRGSSRVHFAAQDEPSLPPGWLVGWSPEYQRQYYANASLGISQWGPPRPLPLRTSSAPMQSSTSQRVPSGRLPPLAQPAGMCRSMLDPINVDAAMRERAAMRDEETRQRAMQERSDYEFALGLSRSLSEQPPHHQPHRPHHHHRHEQPGEAAAAAAAAAMKRARALDSSPVPGPGRLHPLHQASPSQQLRAPLAPVGRARKPYSAAFNAAVEQRFQEWSTAMYANNSFLHEIGATARQEQRDRIRDELEREWRIAKLPVFE